ncbi:MAG: DUF4340 domain-containing protein [Lachnospiraceae bacterium]|nr:DUF4340 domain-containing protein [Lachnospiraceae bacterium]
MKKQGKQMIILLIVLVLLLGGYLGLRWYNEVQSTKTVEEEVDYIISLEEGSVIKYTFEYEGTEYTCEKKDDTWYYTGDPELTLNQFYLTNIASKMEKIIAKDTISDVTDMEQYGLAKPTRTFSFETATERYEFYVGDSNSFTKMYYICKPGENTVYIVDAAVITSMNVDVKEIVVEE